MRARARQVLLFALLVGVAGDVLLRGGAWRSSLTLFVLVAAASALALGGRGQRERQWLLGGLMLASLGFAFRDAEMLIAVDFLSVLCMGALAVWHGSGKRIAELTVVQAVRAAVLAPIVAAFGAAGALGALRSGDGSDATAAPTGRGRAIAIGVVLALPPLLIVAALLGESDTVFGEFLQQVYEFLTTDLMQHVVVIGIVSWLAAGWLRGAVGDARGIRVPEERSPGVAFLVVSVALYGLVALLALYVGVQARALFGGADYLIATAGLTVAEYARRGFHELTFASGVVLGTLVAADWALAPDDAEGRARHRTVGFVLVGLVALLLVSAATRMGLYVREFGLSVDRMIAIAVMTWVLAALATFLFTTLRARPERFAPVLFAATVGWVALVNVVGLEGIVVRVNVARAVRGEAFDTAYHGALSADALPVLLAQASRLPAAECQALGASLRKHWEERLRRAGETIHDWRTLDLPLMRARDWYAAGALPPCGGAG